MKNSLQDFLPIVCPSLNEAIYNPDSLARINNVSQLLPGMPFLSAAGFECRLAANASSTDISVSFAKSSRCMIRDCFESLPDLANKSNIWKKVDKLIKQWMDQESLAYEKIENIWLEFDVEDETSEIPEPSIFFSPHPLDINFHGNNSSFANYNWIVPEILEPLIDGGLSRETISYLSKCCNSLPCGGMIFQAGVMLPRLSESKTIRLCIQGIDAMSIPSYLSSIGWVDSDNGLASIMKELSLFTDSIAINISIDNHIHSKIGIECYIDQQPSPRQSVFKWEKFFDFMTQRKICTNNEVTALLEWPGYTEEESYGLAWPEHLSRGAKLVYPNFRSMVARIISHVKLVYQPSEHLQAKAYLWFGHRWISPNGLLNE